MLTIIFQNNISSELKKLIFLQNYLKHLELIIHGYNNWM